jgi:hypothetical protein
MKPCRRSITQPSPTGSALQVKPGLRRTAPWGSPGSRRRARRRRGTRERRDARFGIFRKRHRGLAPRHRSCSRCRTEGKRQITLVGHDHAENIAGRPLQARQRRLLIGRRRHRAVGDNVRVGGGLAMGAAASNGDGAGGRTDRVSPLLSSELNTPTSVVIITSSGFIRCEFRLVAEPYGGWGLGRFCHAGNTMEASRQPRLYLNVRMTTLGSLRGTNFVTGPILNSSPKACPTTAIESTAKAGIMRILSLHIPRCWQRSPSCSRRHAAPARPQGTPCEYGPRPRELTARRSGPTACHGSRSCPVAGPLEPRSSTPST